MNATTFTKHMCDQASYNVSEFTQASRVLIGRIILALLALLLAEPQNEERKRQYMRSNSERDQDAQILGCGSLAKYVPVKEGHELRNQNAHLAPVRIIELIRPRKQVVCRCIEAVSPLE